MAEPTQTPAPTDTPRGFAYCSWHEGFSGSARLVRAIEQGSGAGGGLFACASCRAAYDLVPFADQAL